jgi:hypothetical protein
LGNGLKAASVGFTGQNGRNDTHATFCSGLFSGIPHGVGRFPGVTRVVQRRVNVVPAYPADGFYYLYDYYPPAPAYYGPAGWYDAPRHRSILLETPFH